MEYEVVEKMLLSHQNILGYKCERGEFKRRFEFSINDIPYTIEWFYNVSNLYLPGGCQLLFDTFKISSSWPNDAKLNLQFYNDRGETVFLIPLDYNPTTKKENAWPDIC